MSDKWRPSYDRKERSHDHRSTPNQSNTSQQEKDTKLLHRKRICDNFIAAYNGEHSDFLGSDTPSHTQHDLFRKEHCTLLLSTSQSSHLLTAPAEFTRYRYRAFSQDPSIEINFERKVYNASNRQDEFVTLATLEISSDQLTGPVVRKFLPGVTPSSFRSAFLDTIASICNDDSDIDSVLQALKSPIIENGVDTITFALSRGEFWIRDSKVQHAAPCVLAQTLQSQMMDLKYVTVIRRAERHTARFGDEFWDYLVARCLRDDVYWGYGIPKRRPTDLSDLEEGGIVEEFL